MKVEQLYTTCLAEAAYYVESNGEVAIIDPLREIDQYIEMANKNNAKIKYIFETHFHADFVSGHVDLAKRTGAKIIFGPTASTGFETIVAEDNQVFQLGDVSIQVLHTPGHTPESSTYLLKDENGKDHCIFSGDTLFIGDVGRPDLAIKGDVTKEQLAGMLYDSLRSKIMPLADDVIVYPAHGAGSACGKNMSSETFASLGDQKRNNYALQDMTKEEFVKEVTTGILPPPAYFPKAAMMNKQGYSDVADVIASGTKGLTALEAAKYQKEGALIIDTRSKESFSKGFIKDSIFIGIDGGFAPWVGTVILNNDQQIVILADEGRENEVATRLARVGYDNAVGYLQGGFNAWVKAGLETDEIRCINASDLEQKLESNTVNIIDARKPSEFEAEHASVAMNHPLDFIHNEIGDFKTDQEYHVHCKSGYRSLIYSSILKRNGISQVVNVDGGFDAMKKTGICFSEFACQSKSA